MYPYYCGVEGEENAGLCSGTENCLAVNSQASEANQQATLDFLKWCVTSEKGIEVLSSIGDIPFKQAPESTNGFSRAGAEMLANGKLVRECAFELGYKDEFYFSRDFKKYFGYAPKYTRKKQ